MNNFTTAEQYIAPGLGIVILLSAFLLGVPLVYQALLVLLGAAAVGSYFAPPAVQVETRIAIAAVGLVILLMISSVAFWLALLSFGAIGALQFQHRHTLQRNLATIDWLGEMVRRVQERRSAPQACGGAEAEAGAAAGAGDGESTPQAPSGAGALPGFVRLNAAGIGGLIAGVLALLSVFLPWYGFLVTAFGEMAGGESLTLTAAAAELEMPELRTFFYVLIALAVASIASIVLPRVVAAAAAAGGLAVTLVSYVYVLAQVEREVAELSSYGVGATAIPAIGTLLAGASFLAVLVLQLIPGANRSG